MRRRRSTKTLNSRAPGSATNAKAKRDETTSGSAHLADGERSIRIRRGETVNEPEVEAGSPARGQADSTRPALDTAARNESAPDSKSQLTLDISEPKPQGYEASAKPPRERIDATRWLWWAMSIGAVTCPMLLGFQLVFTDPAHGANVLAVVATMAFGTLFATWAFEYWLRRGMTDTPAQAPIWTLTRHSILASVGVAAMAVSALNRTASFGLLLLVLFTLVVADIVLRRLRIR